MRTKIYDYHIWDARKICDKIKDKIINVTITSPPYWNLKNYGVDNQIGYRQRYEEEYLADLKNIFEDVFKITNNQGSLWVILDTLKKDGEIKPLPFDLASKLKEVGWKLQDIIIWYKDKSLPWSHKGKLRNIFEYVLFFTKGPDFKYYVDNIKDPDDLKEWWPKYPERYNPKGKTPNRVWYIPIPTQGSWGNGWVRHFCPFPPELVEKILLLTTDVGDFVLDPFAGSGSVLAQAKVMRRKPIGFDLSEDYKKMYERTVLPSIKEMWETRRKELKLMERKRKKFEVTIKNLRQLKYPKELVKRSLKNGAFDGINSKLNTVFVIGKESRYGLLIPDIYLIFDDKIDKKLLLSHFSLLCGKPPLSKYGIKPSFNIYTKKYLVENREKLSITENLFLYSEGRTNYYEQKIAFSEWAKLSEEDSWNNHFMGKIPPILSNIRVYQKDANL